MSKELGLPKKFVIWDCEFTAWKGSHARGWSRPNEHREIIQIGAIIVDGQRMIELDCFSAYVKPTINKKLSEHIINLTGITQEVIDAEGLHPAEALAKFFDWCNGLSLYSWGTGDHKALNETAVLNQIKLEWQGITLRDMKEVFRAWGIAADDYMSSTLLDAFGETSSREGHDGLNDARTVLDALVELQKK